MKTYVQFETIFNNSWKLFINPKSTTRLPSFLTYTKCSLNNLFQNTAGLQGLTHDQLYGRSVRTLGAVVMWYCLYVLPSLTPATADIGCGVRAHTYPINSLLLLESLMCLLHMEQRIST
jgi:hypothetical protein